MQEQATAGATSAGNIASVVSPHIAIGKDRFKKSYTGTPGRIRNKSTQRAKTQETETNRQRTRHEGHQPVWWTSSIKEHVLMEPLILTDEMMCDNCGNDSHCGKECNRTEKDTHLKAQKNTK